MLLLSHLMTCALTPTRSDLVSMTTDAPLKAAAPEFVSMHMCQCACICTVDTQHIFQGHVPSTERVCLCASICSACISPFL